MLLSVVIHTTKGDSVLIISLYMLRSCAMTIESCSSFLLYTCQLKVDYSVGSNASWFQEHQYMHERCCALYYIKRPIIVHYTYTCTTEKQIISFQDIYTYVPIWDKIHVNIQSAIPFLVSHYLLISNWHVIKGSFCIFVFTLTLPSKKGLVW
jgi:hypothetical protein